MARTNGFQLQQFLRCIWLAGATSAAACSPLHVIHLQPEGAAAATHESPLEIIVTPVGVSDPLPVEGTSVALGGLANALAASIKTATNAWALWHAVTRTGGWQLVTEVTQAKVELRSGNISAEISTRVTLRGAVGRIYVDQTQGYCKQVAPSSEQGASAVVNQCLASLSHDLAGWLGGINP